MACQPQISAANRKYVSPSFADQSDPFFPTIQQAINSIIDASLTNPYGIYVYPGVYAEPVTLKSFVSIIGSGVGSTIIKGNGVNPAITGPINVGTGQCYITGLTIDGNGKSACVLPDTTVQNTYIYLVDVYVYSSVSAPNQAAVTVGTNQVLFGFDLHIVNQSTKFSTGILVTGSGQLRLHSSQIAYGNSYCIDHQSSGYSEAYNSFLVGGACAKATITGVINFYVCQTVGRIEAYNSSKIKHVDSFHAGAFNAFDSATIWVSGMQWAEEAGNDIQFALNGTSKIILANSRTKVVTNGLNVVTVNSQTAKFKGMNSLIVNPGTGATITGVSTPPENPTVFLYYCSLNKDPLTVTVSDDSEYFVPAPGDSTHVE